MNNFLGKNIKGYEIQAEIGTGSLGTVFRAYQASVSREVAMKVILPPYANNPVFIRSFESESRSVARLEHPHIVPLIDSWREPEGAFLVMRWLRGGSLKDLLASSKTLDMGRLLTIVEHISSALTLAHRRGIVHGAIKPSNILFDGESNAYLSDFGITSKMGRDLDFSAMVDSLAYAAPEMIEHKALAPQTDVYALGILLFEMLTHRHPFADVTIPQMMITQQLRKALPSVNDFVPNLPQGLDEILQRATAKGINQRYQDVGDLFQELRRVLKSHHLSPSDSPSLSVEDIFNPYKGLYAFDESDSSNFFGRDNLIETLLNRVSQQERFTVLIGASGSGKSSVVHAGVLPRLRAVYPNWFVLKFVPSADPILNLAISLQSILPEPYPNLPARLREDSQVLVDLIRQITHPNGEILFVIDQFEEVFTLVDNEPSRRQFLNLISHLANSNTAAGRFLLILRADFYDRPLLYEDFGKLVQEHTQAILPLARSEIEQAIVEPAKQVGLEVEADLVAKVVADLREEPGALPLLQYALTEIFERRDGTVLTLAAYKSIGGVSGALARRAEEVYTTFSAPYQQIIRQVFLRLITLGEGKEDTRRRVLRVELLESISDHEALRQILSAYERYRLLTFDVETDSREPTVEVAHEALIREWSRLQEWLSASREDIRSQRLLTSSFNDWSRNQQNDDFLLYGTRLAQFEEWLTKSTMALSSNERQFVERSIAQREAVLQKEQERIQREKSLQGRFQRVLQALVIVFLLGSLISVYLMREAQVSRDLAQLERDNAEQSANQARGFGWSIAARQALTDGRPDLAVALAIEANQFPDLPIFVQRTLSDVAYAPGIRWYTALENTQISALAFNPVNQDEIVIGASDGSVRLLNITDGTSQDFEKDYQEIVNVLRFSADGRYVIGGAGNYFRGVSGAIGLSENPNAIVWDSETGAIVRELTGHRDTILSLALSPDNTIAVTASVDLTVRAWDFATGDFILQYPAYNTGISHVVSISPDNTYAASGGADLAVRVWNLVAGTELYVLRGHDNPIESLDFSPDSQILASGADDRLIILWDLSTGQEIRRLTGHGSIVEEVYFLDSNTLLSSSETEIILWDVTTGQEIRRLRGFEGNIKSLSLTYDKQRAVMGSDNGNLYVWDLAPQFVVKRFVSDSSIRDLSVSHDLNWLVSVSRATVSLWDVSSATLVRHFDPYEENLTSIDFHPQSREVLTGSQDGKLQIWDLETGNILHVLEGHTDRISDVAYSRDGLLAFSASEDSSIRLWDLDQQQQIGSFTGHEDEVNVLDVSADDRLLLSGGDDGSLFLWSVATQTLTKRFATTGESITDVKLSPNGEWVLSTSRGGLVNLWSISTGQIIRQFKGHEGVVWSGDFSPDGRYLISSGFDQHVILWEIASGDILQDMTGHSGGVTKVLFDPTGQSALSASVDGTMIAWRTHSNQALIQWIHQNRYIHPFTCAERELYTIPPLCEVEESPPLEG